jgi:hypothetical protein
MDELSSVFKRYCEIYYRFKSRMSRKSYENIVEVSGRS